MTDLKLTTDQWSIIFDALSLRKLDLEDALSEYVRNGGESAIPFIKGKMEQIDEILKTIGPLSV